MPVDEPWWEKEEPPWWRNKEDWLGILNLTALLVCLILVGVLAANGIMMMNGWK